MIENIKQHIRRGPVGRNPAINVAKAEIPKITPNQISDDKTFLLDHV